MYPFFDDSSRKTERFTKKKKSKRVGNFFALPFVKGKDTTGKEAEHLKRLIGLMMIVAVTAALLACTKDGRENENDSVEMEPQYVGADTMTLRVVGDAADGTLILAGETEVYTLPLDGLTLYLDGGSIDASQVESGMSAEVWYTGGVQETNPARFAQVVAVSFSREADPRYDLCGLYLQVLEDLWNADDGLNGGAELVSVDLSKAPGGLTAGEKAAIAYVFAQKHGVQGLTMTFDELREEGYLAGEKTENGKTAYSFPNGLLFTITPEETQDNGASVCFSAGKWRSPLGAYYFTKCTASRGDNGWEYTVGAEAIS